MMNLRSELENNALLRNYLGPFREESNEWGSSTLVFSRHNARITAASSEQGIRGVRHNQNRPDLIIGDDVEDIDSTRTRESRNKTYEWLTGEVIPAGDVGTRLIIVGNLLHEDSLLMRIKAGIEDDRIDGVFKEYPLMIGNQILWPGKYPNMQAIENQRRQLGNEFKWQSEYLLNIIPSEEQAIHREWIQYYDVIPLDARDEDDFPLDTGTRIGIDLAISQKETADYTAMVAGRTSGGGRETTIYILPENINQRLTFPQTVNKCKMLSDKYTDERYPTFVIEDVAYQKSLPQQLVNEGVHNATTTKPGKQDKRTRLVLTANLIKTGKVLFPLHGAEQLINQIVHFGVEKHDDLADAFTTVILKLVEHKD